MSYFIEFKMIIKLRNFVANYYTTKNSRKRNKWLPIAGEGNEINICPNPQSGVVHIVMAIAQPPPSLRRNATALTLPFKYRISTAPKSSHSRSTKQQEEEPIDEKQEGEREITEAERDN